VLPVTTRHQTTGLQEGDFDGTMDESYAELTSSEEDEEHGSVWNERESGAPDEQANIEGGGTSESDDDFEGICVMSPSRYTCYNYVDCAHSDTPCGKTP
jgi:hypothetical protein